MRRALLLCPLKCLCVVTDKTKAQNSVTRVELKQEKEELGWAGPGDNAVSLCVGWWGGRVGVSGGVVG